MTEEADAEPGLEELLSEAISELGDELGEDDDPVEALLDLYQNAAEPMYDGMLEEMGDNLDEWRSELDGFRSRLYDDWQDAIDLLEAFIIYSRDIGLIVNRDYSDKASENDDAVFPALIKLHVRACQVAQEILVLIKHGFADGAHARWRALHEIAAVSMFIKQSGQETAKRFLIHNRVDDFFIAKKVREYPDTIGFSNVSDEEMAEIQDDFEVLTDKFGDSFAGIWGWAAHELGDNPRFTDIEEAAGLEHHRPYHAYASKLNIHAGSKGTMDQLGMMDTRASQTASGPTNFGFFLPGTHTAFSLQQVNTALLTQYVSYETLLDVSVLQMFVEDIVAAFSATEENIAQREEDMIEEIKEWAEENPDEFLEEYEPVEPPSISFEIEEEEEDS